MNKVILGNYISQIRGISYQPNDISKTQSVDFVPILKANNITDDGIDDSDLIFIHKSKVRPEQLIRNGDILIVGSSGSKDIVGRGIEFQSDYNGSFGAFCKLIRVTDHNLDHNYLYFFFKTKFYKEILKRSLQGININNLRNENIDSIAIPLPPLPEQKQIVAILQEADALRRKKKEILEKSNRLASALFLEMFGDPVRNEMRWPKVFLGNVTDLITDGKHGDCTNKENSGYYFISAKDIHDGIIDYSNARQILQKDFEEVHRRTNLMPGDLVIVNTGATIGKMAIATEDFRTQKTTFQKSVAVVKVKLDYLNIFYLKFLFGLSLKDLVKSSSGSAQQNLLLSQMRKIPLILPPLPLQNDFAKKVEAIEDTTKQIESSLQKMEKLYDSLLQKAFTGDLWFDKLTMTSESVELSP